MALGYIIPGYGPAADRPAASQMPGGIYTATDTGIVSRSDGSAWADVSVDTSGYVTLATAQTITGLKTFQPASAAQIGAIVKGAASQTANLQEWQTSAGTVVARVMSNGRLGLGSSISLNTAQSSTVIINDSGASRSGFNSTSLSVEAAASDATAYATYYRDSGAGVIMATRADRRVGIGTGSPSAALHVLPKSATDVGQIIQAQSGQTANLQEWQDNAGALVCWVNNIGRLGFGLSDGNGPTLWRNGNALQVTVGTRDTLNVLGGSVGLNTGANGGIGFLMQPRTNGSLVLAVKGLAGQTANLQEWQSSSGTVLASISATGVPSWGSFVVLGSAPTPTTAGSAGQWGFYAGYLYHWTAASTVVRHPVETSW